MKTVDETHTQAKTMNVRKHPLMVRNSGIISWPPEWRRVGENQGTNVVRGELGILEDASMHELISNKIFLAMTHLSDRYIAVLAFDDPMFAKQLYQVLLKSIGRPIQEIGSLDLSHLL